MTGEPIIVASNSGGKDSQATAQHAIDHAGTGRVRLVFANTGNEDQITLDHLDYEREFWGVGIDEVKADFSRVMAGKRKFIAEKWPQHGVPQEFIDRALAVMTPTGVPFLDMCIWKGRFPSRMAQFCTHELKAMPLNTYILNLMAQGHKVESWQGVRRDESRNRRGALKVEPMAEGFVVRRPIVHWTADMVVRFVTVRRGMRLNPLYRMGMKRVGCMPCINVRKDELCEIARRLPEHIDKIREWEWLVHLAAKSGWATFFTETDAIAGGLGIDASVVWAKTSHGGKQFDLLKAGPAPICSSMYGLCE